MACPHSSVEASLDRWLEVHWHIHQIEQHYHNPEAFRFSFNSFIRSAREVPGIIQMELQNHQDYREKIKPIVDGLLEDPLFKTVRDCRDFLVHRGMLKTLSKGIVGTTEGRGIKLAFRFDIDPFESSVAAYERFKEMCRAEPEIRQLMGPDCDSWPCVYREWKIADFNEELLEVAVNTWKAIGKALTDIVEHLGAEPLDLSLRCRHDPERVKMKEFSQRDFFESVDSQPEARP
jgi:hypothetical protein